jgi:hypothetical protein
VGLHQLALNGGGPVDRKAVVLALTAWSRDCGLTVADRCAVLDELGKLNPRAAKQAINWLREVLDDPSASARDRCSAAQTLLEQEPHDPGATAVLASLIEDPAVPVPVRDKAVGALSFGNPPHRALVADGPRATVLISAADHLARYSPDDRDSAIAILTEQATTALSPAVRRTAAEALSTLRGPVAPRGEAALLALGRDPGLPTYLRRAAAERLSNTGGPARAQGRQLLLSLAGDAAADPIERAAAARALAESAGPLRSALPQVPAPLLAAPRLAPRAALLAAQAAAAHPDVRAGAARRLDELGADPAVHPYLRCQALLSLALQHPRTREDATNRLWTMLRDETAPVHHRCWAAESLGAIGDRLRCPTRNILRDLETSQPRDGRAAARLRRSIQVLSRGGTPTIVESLRRLATADSVLTGVAPPDQANR